MSGKQIVYNEEDDGGARLRDSGERKACAGAEARHGRLLIGQETLGRIFARLGAPFPKRSSALLRGLGEDAAPCPLGILAAARRTGGADGGFRHGTRDLEGLVTIVTREFVNRHGTPPDILPKVVAPQLPGVQMRGAGPPARASVTLLRRLTNTAGSSSSAPSARSA
jgi:hypothetical protein